MDMFVATTNHVSTIQKFELLGFGLVVALVVVILLAALTGKSNREQRDVMATEEWQRQVVPQHMFQMPKRHFNRFRSQLISARPATNEAKGQPNDDQVIVAARHHWMFTLPKVQIPLGCFLVASFLEVVFIQRLPLARSYKGLLFLTTAQLLCLASCWYASIERTYTYWVLTSQHLYICFIPPSWMFWLNINPDIIRIEKIESVGVNKSSISSLSKPLHYGALQIGTLEQAEEDARYSWDFVPFHLKVRNYIQALIGTQPDRQSMIIARGIEMYMESRRAQRATNSTSDKEPDTETDATSPPSPSPSWQPNEPVAFDRPPELRPRARRRSPK